MNKKNQFVVLSIKYGGHDTAAAIMMDGIIIAACEQERYTLDKHSRKFPIDAIKDCLKIAKISIRNVDEIAFVNQPKLFIREFYLKPAIHDEKRLNFMMNDLDIIKKNYSIENLIREKTKFTGIINFYLHHDCHLASAYFPSGFKKTLLMSHDGVGEIATSVYASGNSNKIKYLNKENVYPDSLGLTYSAITFFLGWQHHSDEGIIMGLAPYGDAFAKIKKTNKRYIDLFNEIILENGKLNYTINRKWISFYNERNTWITEDFKKIFGLPRKKNTRITSHHKNIAAALQLKIERIVIKQLKYLKEKYKFENLCIAGGVGLNCSLNGKIDKKKIFKKIFIQPASGDSGCTIGACYLATNQHKKIYPIKENNFYLGTRYSQDETYIEIKKSKLLFNEVDKNYNIIAKKIFDGKIIGWFQGAAEFGPRALGNRSILCRPFPKKMKDYINFQIKFRENFRPFAPAVLYEFANEYFILNDESPHMLKAIQVNPSKKKLIPAVVHVDDSCRVQTVTKSTNLPFYNLIKSFNEISGVPVILNTSFNVKGQPIVNTISQAIKTFMSTKLDCLVIGKYYIDKN